MSWSLYRWVWRVASPLYVGTTPSGLLERCRLYVPARPLWGALTAEVARRQAKNGDPPYARVGKDLREQTRLSYLYPAEQVDGAWCAWLPEYRAGEGLIWVREDGTGGVADRPFRRRLLWTRPATAIDPESDSALDGSLRETECLQTHWRDASGAAAGPVAMVGYVFVSTGSGWKERLRNVETIFVGGNTRYGLGRLERQTCTKASDLFGAGVERKNTVPCVSSKRLLAHGRGADDTLMYGNRESLAGWDTDPTNGPRLHQYGTVVALWTPGTMFSEERTWEWSPDGTLKDLKNSQVDPLQITR